MGTARLLGHTPPHGEVDQRTTGFAVSTPAPDSAPFDPHAFPADLGATQRQAAELYAALRAHQATLP
jgi:hypothetical protein